MSNKKDSAQQTDGSRRRFFATAGGALGVAVLANALPSIARAEDLPHLTTDDPTAKALNYTEDNTKAAAPHQAGRNVRTAISTPALLRVTDRASCWWASRSTQGLVLGLREEGLIPPQHRRDPRQARLAVPALTQRRSLDPAVSR